MALQDVIPSIVIIALIYLFVRWIRKPGAGPEVAQNGAATIRGVTRPMVETVQSAFPHIPPRNIVYSLSKTRSVQATSEEILERGFLVEPPASFSVPHALIPPSSTPSPQSEQGAAVAAKTPHVAQTTSLIDRYKLADRLPSRKGKEREGDAVVVAETAEPSPAGTSAVKEAPWADTKEKREQGLRERKEKMILEARRRMMARAQKAE